MKKLKLTILALFVMILCININAQNKKNTNPFMNYDPEYTDVLTRRTIGILDSINIKDSVKYYKVQSIIIDHYRNISAIYDFKDDLVNKARQSLENPEKNIRIDAIKDSAMTQLYLQHVHFIAMLSPELRLTQIDSIKDGMTYYRFHRDYNAMLELLPQLTEEQKKYIYANLYEARERAIDQGSSKSKHKIFDKYRGRTNNYLSKEGYDLNQAYKDLEAKKNQQK